jgi:signal peptidase
MVVVAALLVVAVFAALFVLPRAFGWSTLVVLSGSMEPAMPVGGLAFVEPVDNDDEVQIGDVVTYPRPDRSGTLVSHRVFAVSDHLGGPTIWTIGDANEAPDPWAVTDDDLVGRVRFTLPYMGTLSQELQTPMGFLIAIAIPAIALIVTELWRIAENFRALHHQRRKAAAVHPDEARLLAIRD